MRKDEFRRRRRQLIKMMGRGGIAILPAVPEKARNGDVHYHYRPDSDFFYLTGFDEPEAVAVLVPGRAQAEYMLFVRDRDPTRETWDGRRAGPDGATREYGADDAFPIADIDEILPGLMENCARVYYTMGAHQEFDQRVIGWVNGLRRSRSRAADSRRRSSSRSITCCTTCGCSSRVRRSTRCATPARIAVARAHARDALRAPGPQRIRGDGGAAARVPAQQRRHLLSPDRRRRRERLHPALPRELRDAARTATCC